jgi:hypothetical protein
VRQQSAAKGNLCLTLWHPTINSTFGLPAHGLVLLNWLFPHPRTYYPTLRFTLRRCVSPSQAEIQRSIERKCEADELRQVVRDQALVNATVCMDSSFGRWIWKTGKTKGGGLVPWNVQVMPPPLSSWGAEQCSDP